jgi:hypothetical protein
MIEGLTLRHLRPIVLALLILASLAGTAVSAAISVVYSTDFSSDPGWVTNNPYTNHWDEAMGMFHYALRDSTNTFIYKKIPYGGESFQLEYDLFPGRTEFQSSFRLGLGTRDMAINQPTTIFSEFENGPYGNIMWLRVIDQQSQRREVSSYSQSYGGPSVRFSDGTPYHVVLEYSREKKTAGIAVSFLSNTTPLWGYTLSSISNLGPMDRIFLSTIGDFENPSTVAEGNLDNVLMRLVLPSAGDGTTVSTSPPTTATGEETPTGSLTRPPSSPPPVTTQKGALPLTAGLLAILGAGVLVLARKH